MENELQIDSNYKSDKFLYEDLEKKVMDIVFRLVEQNKIIDFTKLYNLCIHELKLESVIILNLLDRLQQKKRIIFGQKVIRDLVLVNSTRKVIYRFIQSHPGKIYGQIQQELSLNPSVLEWNIAVLLRFNCLILVRIGKKKVFGIKDQSPHLIKLSYFMQNERISKIIILISKKSFTIKEIISITSFPYNYVFYQLNQLTKEQIITTNMNATEKIYHLIEEYNKYL